MGCASAPGSPATRPHSRGEGRQQSPIQPDLRWGTHNFPGQHGPVSHQPHHKKCLLMSNLNLPFRFKPIVPYPVIEALERSLSLSCLYFSFIYWSPLYTDSSNITINADNILLFSLMLSPVGNNFTVLQRSGSRLITVFHCPPLLCKVQKIYLSEMNR